MALSVTKKIELQNEADRVIKAASAEGVDAGADYQSFMPYNAVENALKAAMTGLIGDEAVKLALEDSSIQDKLNDLLFSAFERAHVLDQILQGE